MSLFVYARIPKGLLIDDPFLAEKDERGRYDIKSDYKVERQQSLFISHLLSESSCGTPNYISLPAGSDVK